MKLLALDTASGCCSAALWIDGQMSQREALTAREHARLLLPMVDALLAEAQLSLGRLDAIAFGRGPGSFTGLRIAAAVTQGLAFGAGLPVLPVSDLEALALQGARRAADDGGVPPDQVLACMDARMGEVYSGLFGFDAAGLPRPGEERVEPPEALLARLAGTASPGGTDSVRGRARWAGAGMGWQAYAGALASLGVDPARVFPRAEPHAREIAVIAAGRWTAGAGLPAEAAVPVYLRDDVARPPRAAPAV